MTAVRAVLFDLDGTLADTAPDLGGALNLLLREIGAPKCRWRSRVPSPPPARAAC